MSKRIWNALLSGGFAALLLAAPGGAAIIDNGDSITDTATNSEWLDLTMTQGDTIDQVIASTLYTVDGYRHATLAEVEELFGNAGFNLGLGPGVNDVSNQPAADDLLGFMGCTTSCGPRTS